MNEFSQQQFSVSGTCRTAMNHKEPQDTSCGHHPPEYALPRGPACKLPSEVGGTLNNILHSVFNSPQSTTIKYFLRGQKHKKSHGWERNRYWQKEGYSGT